MRQKILDRIEYFETLKNSVKWASALPLSILGFALISIRLDKSIEFEPHHGALLSVLLSAGCAVLPIAFAIRQCNSVLLELKSALAFSGDQIRDPYELTPGDDAPDQASSVFFQTVLYGAPLIRHDTVEGFSVSINRMTDAGFSRGVVALLFTFFYLFALLVDRFNQ